MTQKIPFKNSEIRFADEGKGEVVVLLHGYLETLEIWDDFCRFFMPRYRIIRMDIPGHGQSGTVAEIHSMELMAEAVDTVLQYLDIRSCVMGGHSMGGYVALAYLENHPERLKGVCLFHSSPLADSEEKKASRSKEIRLMNEGKLSLICQFSIPNGFAADNLEKFADKVNRAIFLARLSSSEGIIALLKGIRERPDRRKLLENNRLPLLFLLGKKDFHINFDQLSPLAASFPHSDVVALENAGHSGYFEEPEASAKALLTFLEKCFVR
ncbi:MAG: alpha/beta fold hydrolase [Bacteroidales bacterium]|jgi:pimeloyl-ACP methyl ester carboxylesterase|nr:alpha/beta fold hydrolase [Bacteroidales bacterium]